MDALIAEINQLQWLEAIALLLSLGYVGLAARGNSWCWPLGFISTALYTGIFWHVSLVSESFLNAYYMVMAVVGWISWHRAKEVASSPHIVASSKTLRWHVTSITLLSLVSLAWGWGVSNAFNASYPYLDAFTTVFALFTTWMLTQQLRENWIYWIVIDIISVGLYQAKGLWITSILMMFYTAFAVYGWVHWGQLATKPEANATH